MPSFIRVLESTSWADLPDSDFIVNFPLDLLNNVADRKGGQSSYWKADFIDKNSLTRLIGAIFSSRSALGALRLGIIDDTVPAQLGINFKRTTSTAVKDKKIGEENHFDLEIDTLKKTIRIANMVRKNIVTYTASEVRTCFTASIKQGFFELHQLDDTLLRSLARQDKVLTVK